MRDVAHGLDRAVIEDLDVSQDEHQPPPLDGPVKLNDPKLRTCRSSLPALASRNR